MPAILAEHIKWYLSALRSQTTAAQNGGRMSSTRSNDNELDNLFWTIGEDERTAGCVQFAKEFIKVDNPDSVTLRNSRVFLSALSEGNDFTLLTPGTQTDTQDQISGTARWYGIATLSAAAAENATTLSLELEHEGATVAALRPFVAGDEIRIAIRGVKERFYIIAAGGVSWGSGKALTVTLTTGLKEAWTPAAGVTVLVSSVIKPGDLKADISNYSDPSSQYTQSGNLIAYAPGGIYQTWTATVVDSAARTVRIEGDTLGSLGTYGCAADVAPINPASGTPYFRMRSLGFGPTLQNNASITFRTLPAAVAIWNRRIFPAGTASTDYTARYTVLRGESA